MWEREWEYLHDGCHMSASEEFWFLSGPSSDVPELSSQISAQSVLLLGDDGLVVFIFPFNEANWERALLGEGLKSKVIYFCSQLFFTSPTALWLLIIATAYLYQISSMCSLPPPPEIKMVCFTNSTEQAANCECYLHTCLAAKRSHTHKGGQTERWKVRSGQIVLGRGAKAERDVSARTNKSQLRAWKQAVKAGSGHKGIQVDLRGTTMQNRASVTYTKGAKWTHPIPSIAKSTA